MVKKRNFLKDYFRIRYFTEQVRNVTITSPRKSAPGAFCFNNSILGKFVTLIERYEKPNIGGYKHMVMTPDDFFEDFVQGNYEDYLLNQGSIRHAFNAAVPASHLADHYLKYYRKNDPSKVSSFEGEKIGDFVEYLSKKTKGCFRDIRSISNAYKHLYTSDISSVGSPGAIESISFHDKALNVKNLSTEFANSKVVYTRKDGRKIDFLPTLETVIKVWEELLYKMNR
jgi:hypothetical protein